MIDRSKIVALIPAFNEEKSIGLIVREVVNLGLKTYVVDDGSTDQTKAMAQKYGACVIQNELNEGKGASLICGLKTLLDRTDFEFVIFLDADGQHDPKSIPSFIDAAKCTNADVIIGNRMHNPANMPWDRLWVNRVTSWIVSKLIGQSIPDCQCGYRLIKRSVVEKVRLSTQRYDIECDIIIQAVKEGFSIKTVPIDSIYRQEKSHIQPIRDTFLFIKLIIRALFQRKNLFQRKDK